jgi:hypothetical protein
LGRSTGRDAQGIGRRDDPPVGEIIRTDLVFRSAYRRRDRGAAHPARGRDLTATWRGNFGDEDETIDGE